MYLMYKRESAVCTGLVYFSKGLLDSSEITEWNDDVGLGCCENYENTLGKNENAM